jgi:hypothetical protein
MSTRKQADGYFGWCPHCRNNDGYLNVGRSHWFVCDEHKTKWCIGANLFSSWRDETEEEQRHLYYERGIDKYQEVEPVFPPEENAPTAFQSGDNARPGPPPWCGDEPWPA